MCGIAGIVRVHPAGTEPPPPQLSIPDAWLDTLDAGIAHRGPDGCGRFRDRAQRADGCTVDVALVHRRLAIIDPVGGAQPMIIGDGPTLLATVFNGCIYNHRELRRELSASGRRFTTDHADTEVIPHAYARWGDDAPAHMDGMFAFAVWDRAKAEFFLARDIAGEKPLYECHAGVNTYAFASTAAALGRWRARFGAALGLSGFSCSRSGLAHWLRFGGSLVPLLNEVDEVDVRVSSRFTADDSSDGPYNWATRSWYEDLPARRPTGAAPTPSPQEVDALISAGVQSRLESDVPLGCFLSGGVDSSLIALHARRALGSLRTLTVRMPDARYDESAFASQAAGLIGSQHETLECDARPAEQLVHLIGQLGLPLGDSSLLPTYWVSKAAREHVKVALSGDGGDELFAGYERHVAARWLAQSGEALSLIPEWLGHAAHPKSLRSKLARLGIAARGGYEELVAIFSRTQLGDLAPALRESLAPPGGPPHHPGRDGPRWDFEWYLPGDLLRKTDTASMAVGLEVRAPLLARSTVHLGLSTPLDALMPHGQRKGLLRQVARLHFPAALVDRPKMGFAIPIGEWFRSDFGGLGALLQDTLAHPDPFPASLLGLEVDRRCVGRLLGEHMTGRTDHSQRLYMLLVLALWCRSVEGWGNAG